MARSTTLPHSQRASPSFSADRGSGLAPLTPAQVLVLSDAARRSDGGAILPERLKGKAAEKLVQALPDKGSVREVRAKADLPVWRRDATGRAFALVLTKLGRAAVPTEDPARDQAAVGETPAPAVSLGTDTVLAPAPDPLPRTAEAASPDGSGMVEDPARDLSKKDFGFAPRPGSKLGAVIALLGRDTGASVEEIMGATGWLPHTTRAALTGLRKRGFALTRARVRPARSTASMPMSRPDAMSARTKGTARPASGLADAAAIERELAWLDYVRYLNNNEAALPSRRPLRRGSVQ